MGDWIGDESTIFFRSFLGAKGVSFSSFLLHLKTRYWLHHTWWLPRIKNVLYWCHVLSLQTWIDPRLTWNVSEFEGLDTIYIPVNKMWTPDVLLYNRWVLHGAEAVPQQLPQPLQRLCVFWPITTLRAVLIFMMMTARQWRRLRYSRWCCCSGC